MNKSITAYLANPDVTGIMNAVGSRYSKNIDLDQIESIKLNTLWECIMKYDESRGAKFTSFLYQQLNFALKNELKRKRREFQTENIENTSLDSGSTVNYDFEVFDGLPEETATLLSQKYIYNMTMVEIGQENGYSRETARRKLARALKFYQNKNRIEI